MFIFLAEKISYKYICTRAARLILCLFIASAIPVAAEGLIAPGGWTDGFNTESEAGDRWHLNVSPYSFHFSRNPEHRYVWLVGTERERANGALTGAAFF